MPIVVIETHWQLELKQLPNYYRDIFWWETLDHGLSVTETWQKPSNQTVCRWSRAFLARTHLDHIGSLTGQDGNNNNFYQVTIHLRTRSREALMGFCWSIHATKGPRIFPYNFISQPEVTSSVSAFSAAVDWCPTPTKHILKTVNCLNQTKPQIWIQATLYSWHVA